MRVSPFPIVMFFLLPVRVSWGQGPPTTRPEGTQAAPQTQTAPAAQQTSPSENQKVEEEHPRLFGIFPTYTISNNKSLTPLSAGGKFHLFVKDATDPYSFAGVAVGAGLSQAQNSLAGYGQGAAGYGKRFGAGLADETSGEFFSTFFFPSLFHEDPRYVREGSSPFKARFVHAILRPVVTRKDSGGRDFNWSGILGRFVASGVSNTYYPKGDTGGGAVFSRAAIGLAFSVPNMLFYEFGPDVEKKIFGKKQKPQP